MPRYPKACLRATALAVMAACRIAGHLPRLLLAACHIVGRQPVQRGRMVASRLLPEGMPTIGNGQKMGRSRVPHAGRHHRQVLHKGGGTTADRISSLSAVPKLIPHERSHRVAAWLPGTTSPNEECRIKMLNGKPWAQVAPLSPAKFNSFCTTVPQRAHRAFARGRLGRSRRRVGPRRAADAP